MTAARGATASPPPPGSNDVTPRTPPAPSAPHVSYKQKCVVLVDWWLERVDGEEGKIRVAGIADTTQMRKGASSSKGKAGRVFRSATIARRHDFTKIETEDGLLIRIGRPLNISRTRENGFPEQVCECFEFGFPFQWQKLANPNMEPENEHARSPSNSTANAPSHPVEYYMEKFLSGCFTNSYPLAEKDLSSSRWSTWDTGVPAIQWFSNLFIGNAGNSNKMAASVGLCNGRMDMPEEPLAPPGETCSSGQISDQHESNQIDALEKETINFSNSSVSVKQSTGPICSNSKVDGNISTQSKIVLVEKEGYRSRVGCGQAEQDADIQHGNRHSCSTEQEMVTCPIRGTPKCGKTSANLGTADALEVPTRAMTPQTAAVRGSEDNSVRRLRSGKVFGMPSSAPMKRDNKRKRMQQESSNKKKGTK